MSRSQSRAGVSSSSSSSLLTALNRAVPRFMSGANLERQALRERPALLLSLPQDILALIASFLVQNPHDFYAFRGVCRQLLDACEFSLSRNPALAFRMKPVRLHPLPSPYVEDASSTVDAFLVEHSDGRLFSIVNASRSPDSSNVPIETYAVKFISVPASQMMVVQVDEIAVRAVYLFDKIAVRAAYVFYASPTTLWCYEPKFSGLLNTYSSDAPGKWQQAGFWNNLIFHRLNEGGVTQVLLPKTDIRNSTGWQCKSIKFPTEVSPPVVKDCFVLSDDKSCLFVSEAGHVYAANLRDSEVCAVPLSTVLGEFPVINACWMSRSAGSCHTNWLGATKKGKLYYYDDEQTKQLVRATYTFERMLYSSSKQGPELFEDFQGKVCAFVDFGDRTARFHNAGRRVKVFRINIMANAIEKILIQSTQPPLSLGAKNVHAEGCVVYFSMKDGSISRSEFRFFQKNDVVEVESHFETAIRKTHSNTAAIPNIVAMVSSHSDVLFLSRDGRVFCAGASKEGLFGGKTYFQDISDFVRSKICRENSIVRIGVYGIDFFLVTSGGAYYVLRGKRNKWKDYVNTKDLRIDHLFDAASLASAEVRTLELVDPYAEASTTSVTNQAATFSATGGGKEEEDEWLQSNSSASQSVEAGEDEDDLFRYSEQPLKPAGRTMDYSKRSSGTFRSSVPVHSQQDSDSYSELQIGEGEALVSGMDRDAQSEQLAWYEVLCCKCPGRGSG